MENVVQGRLPTPPRVEQPGLQSPKSWPPVTRHKSLSAEEELGGSAVKNARFCIWKDPRREEVHPDLEDRTTLLEFIQSCAKQRDLCNGSSAHAHILDRGLLQKDIALGNALLSMYAKCGSLVKAQHIFDLLPMRNVVTWNALISAYVQHGLNAEALHLFEQMQDEGLSPNAVTFICCLKACSNISSIEKGVEIHSMVRKQRLLEKDIALGTALVDMYSKYGALSKAQSVFDKLLVRNVVTWTSLIYGYAQHGLGYEALNCYDRMQDEGFTPNAVTFVCILKACSSIGEAEKGEEIHRQICRQGLLEKEVVLGNALVDMYAKCGALVKARGVLQELPLRNVATWTALISGYVWHGLDNEALRCFDHMQDEELCPDAVTFICVLQACGNLGAAEKGEELSVMADRQGLLFKDTVLGTALVDMHAKCGKFAKAHEVFERLPARNVASWTALISGYAHVGKMDAASHLFVEMLRQGLNPNLVTFIVLLNACSHEGLVKEGQMFFEMMSESCCIMPTSEHYTCVIDIMSRAGRFDEAISMIHYLQVQPSDGLRLWSSVMGACQKWGNLELGKWTFEHMLDSNEKLDAACVCMRNIAAGMHRETEKIEAMRM